MAFAGKAALLPRGYGAWAYKSQDSIATVSAANYFRAAYDELELGDRILVTTVTNLGLSSEAYVAHDNLVVIADSSTTVLTASTLAYGHNSVGFASNALIQKNAKYTGAADIQGFTVAFKIRFPALPPGTWSGLTIYPGLFLVNPLLYTYWEVGTPKVKLAAISTDALWFLDAPISTDLSANAWYTIHAHASTAYGAIGEVRGTCNGVDFGATAFSGNVGSLDLGAGVWTNFRIWAQFTGADLGFFYFNDAADSDTTHFWAASGDVDLGDDGTLSGASAPKVFFGGRQKANDRAGDAAKGWRDRYNQGTGGNFNSLAGSITDVAT